MAMKYYITGICYLYFEKALADALFFESFHNIFQFDSINLTNFRLANPDHMMWLYVTTISYQMMLD